MIRWLAAICGALCFGLFLIGAFAAMPSAAAAQGFLKSDSYGQATRRQEPLQVKVGILIDQITSVDQKAENYGAVVSIALRWVDPLMAFDEEEAGTEVRVMRPEEFVDLAQEKVAIAPTFVIQNQQSNRWTHEAVVAVRSNGTVSYFERASLTLQAPHFDFTKYPFDTQNFYFEIISVYPEHIVEYVPWEELSGLGELLGEEEWILENASVFTRTRPGMTGQTSSEVVLGFEGRRHIQYYVIRIFLPMLVLISVSWASFFLEEYRKRIEIAGANLLVFVAFNFAISDSLPRLGYLTFLDFILQWMFVVTGAIIVFNVVLRRLKLMGREALAQRIDTYAVKWIYPIGYAAIVGSAVYIFLIQPDLL